MGGSDLRHSCLGALLTVLLIAGCSSSGASTGGTGSGRDTLPPRTLTPPPAPAVNETPTPPPTPSSSTAALAGAPPVDSRPIDVTEPAPTGDDETLIYVDSAEAEGSAEPITLVAAAAREKARRRSEAEPVLVITNKNLAAYAEGGVLTISNPDPSQLDIEGDEAEAELAEMADQEEYWRQRGIEVRQRWRDAVDRIPELVDRVEKLRNQFYAEDDPAYRDGQIKPQWDRALADLEKAQQEAARGEAEVATYLEEGRRAGAFPGWLREGAELEPEPVDDDDAGAAEDDLLDPSEPVDPVILEEPEFVDPPLRNG